MKPCPRCQTKNRDTAAFCSGCGYHYATGSSPQLPIPTGLLSSNTQLAGRYRVLKKIGSGGMAAIYLAEDGRLPGKFVAVKEMSAAGLTNPAERMEAINAFHQEARLLATLNHPHLPRVTDVFQADGREYLVMDYIQGETLEKKLDDANGPLPERQVMVWAGQLCDVLHYLHSQKPTIIFRDLKPANIMISQDGAVKLIDFGIARHFKPGKGKDTTALGTAGYAPHEQYGKGQTDQRSDIYALGATLHFLLTGRDPADTPFKFLPVRQLNPAISPHVEQAVMQAVEHEPARRWHTVAAFKKALASPAAGRQPSSSAAYGSGSRPNPALPATNVLPHASPYMSAPSMAAVPAIGGAAVPARPTYSSAVSSHYPTALTPASLGRRFAAHLIDLVLVFAAQSLVTALGTGTSAALGLSADDTLILQLFFSFAGLFGILAYYAFFYGWSGQTIGDMVAGTQVVQRDGSPVSWPLAIWRAVVTVGIYMTAPITIIYCCALPVIALYYIPFKDKEQRTLQDQLSMTRVVSK
jgi:serine/threonine protein kinase